MKEVKGGEEEQGKNRMNKERREEDRGGETRRRVLCSKIQSRNVEKLRQCVGSNHKMKLIRSQNQKRD